MSNRKNPYTELLQRVRRFAMDVAHRRVRTMWNYPKEKLSANWRLDDLAERVQAADQLGWDVLLKVKDGALHVEYHQRVTVPMEFQ